MTSPISDTQPFKEKLLKEKELLEQELNHIAKKVSTPDGDDWVATTAPDSGTHPDVEDNADEVIDFEARAALLAPLEQQYKDVTDALAKIEAGTYGICEKTGDPLPLEQLETNPSARECVQCSS